MFPLRMVMFNSNLSNYQRVDPIKSQTQRTVPGIGGRSATPMHSFHGVPPVPVVRAPASPVAPVVPAARVKHGSWPMKNGVFIGYNGGLDATTMYDLQWYW